MSTKKILWFVIPLSVFLFAVLFNIVLASRASSVGSQVWQLEKKRKALVKYNESLETQVAQVKSLHGIQDEAIASGYVPIHGVVMIAPLDNSLALNPSH